MSRCRDMIFPASITRAPGAAAINTHYLRDALSQGRTMPVTSSCSINHGMALASGVPIIIGMCQIPLPCNTHHITRCQVHIYKLVSLGIPDKFEGQQKGKKSEIELRAPTSKSPFFRKEPSPCSYLGSTHRAPR